MAATRHPRRRRAIAAAVLVAGGLALLAVEARGILADRREHRGTVTVTRCVFETYAQHGNIYACHGSFSDGHDLQVPDVRFDNVGHLAAGVTVIATVTGPDDTTAHLTSEGRWRLVLTLGGAALLIGCAISLWRAPVRSPAASAP